MEQSRIYAMAFIAGHDALNATTRRFQPYLHAPTPDPLADPGLAYVSAVHGVLQAVLPGQASVAAEHAAALAAVPAGAAKDRAIAIGQASAQALLTARADDGAAQAQGPYAAGTAPGAYRPTPPVDVATFVRWGQVKPFALTGGAQFRPPAPYATTEAAYAIDFVETKLKGGALNSARSDQETQTALTWLESTPISWQRITTQLFRDYEMPDLWQVARGLALLQMAQADAYIGALEAKYHHNFWRPITAIREAGSDGNPDTIADPAWSPLDPVTPPVPEYPSAHAAAATAGASIVRRLTSSNYYAYWMDGLDYASTTHPGVSTYLGSAEAIANAIGLSRIYVGYHFRQAVEAGWAQGSQTGTWVLDHQLLPVA
jgi:PAP2 superfamily